ncbi:MAG: NAD(P)/FAD-dependent oxidoreductase [Acidobacteriota bacterium]
MTVLIAGAGPAGVAAALELHRRSIPFRIVDRGGVGGMLRSASWIRNYPGFPGGIAGEDLAHRLADQLSQAGIEPASGSVGLDTAAGHKFAATIDCRPFACDAVIVAAGTRARPAGFDGEKDLGERLLYDVSQHPAASNAVVIGSGDVAFDYAVTLARRGVAATLLCRTTPKAIPFLHEQVRRLGVEVRAGVEVSKATVGNDGAVMLRTGDGSSITTDVVVVAVGRTADRSLLDRFDRLDIRSDGRTSVEGLFLAGDVLHPALRQVGVAVGDGIRAAAMAAESIGRPCQ